MEARRDANATERRGRAVADDRRSVETAAVEAGRRRCVETAAAVEAAAAKPPPP